MILTGICSVFCIICFVSSLFNKFFNTGIIASALMASTVSLVFLFFGRFSVVLFYPFILCLVTTVPLSLCFLVSSLFGYMYFSMFSSISGFLVIFIITVVAVASADGKKFGVFNISASFSVGILCIAYLLDSLITRGRFDFDWYFILAALVIVMNEFYINQYTVPKIRKIIHNLSGIF